MEHSTEARRYDIYAVIHKALRAFMCDTLVALGSTDADDEQEARAVIAQVRELAALCASHVEHENNFVHTAMEARRPGSSAETADDHDDHRLALDRLTSLAGEVEQAAGGARAAALNRLYRYLAVFVGENLVHMETEEAVNNAVLWSAYTDAELSAIEGAIHQTIPPAEMASFMRWLIPAVSAAERAGVLEDMRKNAPLPVFGGMLDLARSVLPARDFGKLSRALALSEPLAA